MRNRWLLTLAALFVLGLAACQPIQPLPETSGAAPAGKEAAAPAPAQEELAQEEAAALAVVEEYTAMSASHVVTAQNLDEYLAFYAPDAVFTTLARPGNPDKVGIDAIRQFYLTDVLGLGEQNQLTYEILDVDGNTVVARVLSDGMWQKMLDVPPYEQVEVFEIQDGLIQADTLVMAPDSLEQAMNDAVEAGYGVPVSSAPQSVLDTVGGATAPVAGGSLSADAIEQALQYYADDVVFTRLGLPGGMQVYAGKDALRSAMEEWSANGMRAEFEPLFTWSDTLAGRSRMWDDDTEAMGIAPLVGVDNFEVSDGLITTETWIISPASLEQLLAATAE